MQKEEHQCAACKIYHVDLKAKSIYIDSSFLCLFSERWCEVSGVWQFWRLTRSALLLHMWSALPWDLSGRHCHPAEEGWLAVSGVQSLPLMQVSNPLYWPITIHSSFIKFYNLFFSRFHIFGRHLDLTFLNNLFVLLVIAIKRDLIRHFIV